VKGKNKKKTFLCLQTKPIHLPMKHFFRIIVSWADCNTKLLELCLFTILNKW